MSGFAKQVMDLKPSMGVTAQLSDEQQRRWSDRAWESKMKGNYDRSRAHLNFEVSRDGEIQPIDLSISIPKRMALRLRQLGLKDPNTRHKTPKRRTAATIIFGGSRERMRQLAFGDQKVDYSVGADNSNVVRNKEIEEWAKDIYRFACEQWGEDNIVGCYAHLDETNPHLHLTVMPITPDGKLSFNQWHTEDGKVDFRQKMSVLHDRLAIYNRRWGLDRGDSVTETGAKHRNTEDYYRDLSRKSSELERSIDERTATLSDLYNKIKIAEKRVKGLTTMLSNLGDKRKKLDGEIQELKKRLSEDSSERDRIQEELDEKQNELDDVVSKIADKEAKQSEAYRILEDLQKEIADRKSTLEELRNQTSQTRAQKAQSAIMQAGFESVVTSFGKLVKQISSEEDKALFDGTMLSDLAKNGSNIVTCAGLLFAGYLNEATELAKGSGGGGGGSDLPWGRDPKDDDRIWALKCLHQAHRMMKPSVVRTVKRKR